MLLEPSAGQFKKLRRRLQIDFGPDNVLMSEIGRQRWQLGVDIDTLVRPSRQSVHGKGVAELMGASTDASAGWLDAELAQQPANGTRCRCNGQRRGTGELRSA